MTHAPGFAHKGHSDFHLKRPPKPAAESVEDRAFKEYWAAEYDLPFEHYAEGKGEMHPSEAWDERQAFMSGFAAALAAAEAENARQREAWEAGAIVGDAATQKAYDERDRLQAQIDAAKRNVKDWEDGRTTPRTALRAIDRAILSDDDEPVIDREADDAILAEES